MEFLMQPWPWYVAGPLISLVVFLMYYLNKSFGVSRSYEVMCAIGGASKFWDLFNVEWRDNKWNLVFVLGMLIGGYVSAAFLTDGTPMNLAPNTIHVIADYGVSAPSGDIAPAELFNWENLTSVSGFILIVVGGFLIGFGTRYAGGCTSGHGITGLSNLQLPSLVAVISFFVGGFITVYLIYPLIF